MFLIDASTPAITCPTTPTCTVTSIADYDSCETGVVATEIDTVTVFSCSEAAYTNIITTVDGFEVTVTGTERVDSEGCTPVASVFNTNSGRWLEPSEFTYDGVLLTVQQPG